jgi:hypothetical protein
MLCSAVALECMRHAAEEPLAASPHFGEKVPVEKLNDKSIVCRVCSIFDHNTKVDYPHLWLSCDSRKAPSGSIMIAII